MQGFLASFLLGFALCLEGAEAFALSPTVVSKVSIPRLSALSPRTPLLLCRPSLFSIERQGPEGGSLRCQRQGWSILRSLRCKEEGGKKKPLGLQLAQRVAVPAISGAMAVSLAFSGPHYLADIADRIRYVKEEVVQVMERKEAVAFMESSDANLMPNEKHLIRLFRDNTPSVVFIATFTDQQNTYSNTNIDEMPRGTGDAGETGMAGGQTVATRNSEVALTD